MIEHQLLDPVAVASCVIDEFAERDSARPPSELPPMPAGWAVRYDALVVESETSYRSYAAAVDLVCQLWAEMFPALRR